MSEITDKVALRIEAAIKGYTMSKGQRISWASLAKNIGYTPQAPTNWKKGKISFKVLEQIATFLGADPTWLMYGSAHDDLILKTVGLGKIRITNPHIDGFNPDFNIAEVDAQIFEMFTKHAEALKDGEGVFSPLDPLDKYELNHVYPKSELKDKNFKVHDNLELIDRQTNVQFGAKKVKLVPIISYVQAGAFKEAILNEQDNFIASYMDNLGDNSFALEVKGESMSPEFRTGDKIIVDPDVQPNPGDYVIAQNGEHEATFKKYRPRGYDTAGEVIFELTPLNPDYPILSSSDQEIRIIGTVVEHIRALRRRHT